MKYLRSWLVLRLLQLARYIEYDRHCDNKIGNTIIQWGRMKQVHK